MPSRRPATHSQRSRPAHQVRIIGGQWKRTPLAVVDEEGLRPTPDRVRETVFNWLTHLFDRGWARIRCLDLFAGTGALGMEAASRGALQVTMVEQSTAAVKQLDASKEKLHADNVTILRGDALRVATHLATRQPSGFELIFVDPPYCQGWLEKVLPVCGELLGPGGLVYAESEMPLVGDLAPQWMENWEVVRADKAGSVYFHLLRRASA